MWICRVCKHNANDEPWATRYRLFPAELFSTHTCSACLELKILENQIAETKAFLFHLQTHLHALRSNYNHAHDLFTHSLPPELMSRIFEFCAANAPDEILSRLLLGAVCKRWRRIAWATPSLWATVHVDLDTRQCHVELLSQWLGRLGQLPLSVRVSGDDDSRNTSMHPLTLQHPLGVLNQYSSRWKDLSISMPFSLLPLLCGSGMPCSSLKSLTIAPHVDNDDELLYTGEGAFKLSNGDPHPDTVSIRGLPFSAVHIDWSNVMDVHFGEMTYFDCMSLFRQASRLIKCSITTEDHGNIVPDNAPLVHTSITHLTIVFGTWDIPDDLLDHISLPALKDMNCTVEHSGYNSFISLLSRSGCVLTSLALTNFNPPTSEDLANLLRNTSSLENFALQTPHIPPSFFELFTPPEPKDVGTDNPIFLPLLRIFQYWGCESHMSWKSFIEAAESILRIRRQNGMPLPSFKFVLDLEDEESDWDSSQAELTEVTVARLCSLIDRGVGLKISNGSEDLLQRAKRHYEAERFGDGVWDEEPE